MLFLSRADVEAALDLEALIEAVAEAHADLARGLVSMPPRSGAAVPERDGLLAAMPAYLPSAGALTAKLVTLFPNNEPPHHTHQALITAFDPATGTPIAVMDGTAITAMRTAAASALSARLLARAEAHTLAIVGTGVQARSHARAMRLVRDIRDVRVAGRALTRVEQLADEIGATPCASIEEALRGADIVCTTTHASEPVVRRPWIGAGTHVIAVGYNPSGGEIDIAAVRDARVFVESRVHALQDYPVGLPDLVTAWKNGQISADHIQADLGELVLGLRPGRTSPNDITLYRSGGVAIQDAAAVALVLRAARERKLGTTV